MESNPKVKDVAISSNSAQERMKERMVKVCRMRSGGKGADSLALCVMGSVLLFWGWFCEMRACAEAVFVVPCSCRLRLRPSLP